MGDEGDGVVVSAVYVGGTRILSSTADVLRMSGDGGVCEMCMCLARAV